MPNSIGPATAIIAVLVADTVPGCKNACNFFPAKCEGVLAQLLMPDFVALSKCDVSLPYPFYDSVRDSKKNLLFHIFLSRQ